MLSENFEQIKFDEKQIFQNKEEISKILEEDKKFKQKAFKITEKEIFNLLVNSQMYGKKSIIDEEFLMRIIEKLIIYKIHRAILKDKNKKDIFEFEFPRDFFKIEYQRYQAPQANHL